MQITVLSGPQGSGKTTQLQRLAAAAVLQGRTAGGIVSPAVFEFGRRVGYDVLDLQSGRRRPLARLTSLVSASTKAGAYAFDDAAIAEGSECIRQAVNAGLTVIAVDEIGPLEFRGGGWAPALALALRSCIPGCELILSVRPALADHLAARFPSEYWPDARVVTPPWPALPDPDS
jgi:nucleoside-triphosphatase